MDVNSSEAVWMSRTNAERADPNDRIGSVVREKWRVDALIGSGGMAAVYSATHRNGQRAALKVLHNGLASERAVRERFLREGYVTNAVNHPACVAVLDDDVTDDGAPFLVMELLEGETLRDLWKRMGKRLSVVQAFQIMDPVLDCLAACHIAGVIHRDLKPPNIFLTKAGGVKVLDFGVAQLRSAATERTRAGTALGTPHYMSPEQAMGLVDQLDGRADLFSVGAILYALLTGRRIHTARTENEALILAATTPVPSIARLAPDLPVDVIALVDKALSWDRRVRCADAKEMQASVRQVLAQLDASATRAAISPSAHPFSTSDGDEPTPESGHESLGTSDIEELASEDDPRVVALRDLFKQVERLLPNVRQFGWEHPATQRALRQTFQQFVDALRADPDAIRASCRPYSFLCLGQTVWEPGPPFDGIPYNLFECGIREMRLRPGITLEEFRQTLELWIADPARDLAPEDDIAAALWDRGLTHVECEMVDIFAEGGAGERELFLTEANELEQHAAESAMKASALEARAMAVATDVDALHLGATGNPMALDDVSCAAVAARLDLPEEQWSERYVRVLVDALVETDAAGDASLVLDSLNKSSCDLIVAGRLDVVFSLREALHANLESRLSADKAGLIGTVVDAALVGGEALTLVLEQMPQHPEMMARLQPGLMSLDPSHVERVLASYRTTTPDAVRQMLDEYLEEAIRYVGGDIAVRISELDPGVAPGVLAMLKNAGTPTAKAILSELSQSKDPTIRIESQILLADTPEALQAELTRLCSDPSSRVRICAYRALARHGLRAATPTIARQIRSSAFNTIEAEERRQLLVTLLALSPDRGEELALEMARKSGLLTSESREAGRVSAIEALGEASRSLMVARSLRELAQARWGVSEEAKSAAVVAASRIEERLTSTVRGGAA